MVAVDLESTGYYNPLLAYGEEKAIQSAKAAGANGFIMVDLPPEEAIGFRQKCANVGYESYLDNDVECETQNIFSAFLIFRSSLPQHHSLGLNSSLQLQILSYMLCPK